VVAQTYIDDPYLIDGLKFDLRMYVLIFGIHPLRIYLFDDGLARFATNSYVSAKDGDITDLFQHLTNYAINKLSSAYVQNENMEGNGAGVGEKRCHKRSLKDIYSILL
jgi:tubulin polyglutamylase TTLL6/13